MVHWTYARVVTAWQDCVTNISDWSQHENCEICITWGLIFAALFRWAFSRFVECVCTKMWMGWWHWATNKPDRCAFSVRYWMLLVRSYTRLCMHGKHVVANNMVLPWMARFVSKISKAVLNSSVLPIKLIAIVRVFLKMFLLSDALMTSVAA